MPRQEDKKQYPQMPIVRFVIIVNDFEPLTIITKRSILDVAAVLDPPLIPLSFLNFWKIFNPFVVFLYRSLLNLNWFVNNFTRASCFLSQVDVILKATTFWQYYHWKKLDRKSLNPLMHNVPKWSDILQKSCSFKVCLTILGHYALKG